MDFLFTIDRDEFWENVLGENSEQLRPAIESIMAILVPDIDECVISTFEAYYDDMLMQSAAQGVLALYLGEIFDECFDEDNENIMCDIDFDAGSIPLTVFEGILNAKCDDNDAEMYKANLLLQCPNGIPEIDLPELNVSIKNFKSCLGGDSECGYAISYVDAVLRLAENVMAYFDIDCSLEISPADEKSRDFPQGDCANDQLWLLSDNEDIITSTMETYINAATGITECNLYDYDDNLSSDVNNCPVDLTDFDAYYDLKDACVEASADFISQWSFDMDCSDTNDENNDERKLLVGDDFVLHAPLCVAKSCGITGNIAINFDDLTDRIDLIIDEMLGIGGGLIEFIGSIVSELLSEFVFDYMFDEFDIDLEEQSGYNITAGLEEFIDGLGEVVGDDVNLEEFVDGLGEFVDDNIDLNEVIDFFGEYFDDDATLEYLVGDFETLIAGNKTDMLDEVFGFIDIMIEEEFNITGGLEELLGFDDDYDVSSDDNFGFVEELQQCSVSARFINLEDGSPTPNPSTSEVPDAIFSASSYNAGFKFVSSLVVTSIVIELFVL